MVQEARATRPGRLETWQQIVPIVLVALVVGQTLAFYAAYQSLDRSEPTGHFLGEKQLPPKVERAQAILVAGLAAAAIAGLGLALLVRWEVISGRWSLGAAGLGLLLGLPEVWILELGGWISTTMVLWWLAYLVPGAVITLVALGVVAERRWERPEQVPGQVLAASFAWGLAGVGVLVWAFAETEAGVVLGPAAAALVVGLGLARWFPAEGGRWPRILTMPIITWWAIHVTILVGLWIRMDALVAAL